MTTAAAPAFRLGLAALAVLVAAGLDGLLLGLAWRGDLGAATFLVPHLVLAIGSAFALARIAAGDRTGALLVGLGLLVMGPFGALLALAATGRVALRPSGRVKVERWHRRLSGAPEPSAARSLHEDIVEGRAYQPGARPPRFASVMEAGSVGDRQAVLGLLVKERVPAPPELMALALRSSDVAVRASAAAAVAKLRERAQAEAGAS